MRRSLLIAAIALLLLAAGGLTAAWFVVSDRLLEGVDRWAEEQRERGWTVDWAQRARSGFPLSVTGRFEAPRIEDPKGWRWEGESLSATIDLLNWREVSFEGYGPQRFFWPGMPADEPAKLLAEEKGGRVAYDEAGRLSEGAFRAKDAEITHGGRALLAETLLAEVRAPRSPERYDVPVDGAGRLRMTGVTLPEDVDAPLGRVVTLLEVAGLLTGDIPLDGPLDTRALRSWAASGGILDLETVSLDWGPLTLRGEGSVTLDELDRPLGAFTVRLKGLPETLERLARRGLIDSGVVFTVQAMALAVAKTDPADGRREITLPIELQDGWLSIGPPIGPLPLIRLQPVALEP